MDQLTVIALYPTQDEITHALFEAIAASECEQVDVRLDTKGEGLKALFLTLSGSWNQLTRFKNRLSLVQKNYSVTVITKESRPTLYPSEATPYQAYMIASANHKILDRIIQFFLDLSVSIHTLSVNTYQAPLTNAWMFDINLVFIVPYQSQISDYRESILQFCDENNFEIVLEAKRM